MNGTAARDLGPAEDRDRIEHADEESERVARQRRYDKLDRDEDRYDRERYEDI
jgi:hypothetical protein